MYGLILSLQFAASLILAMVAGSTFGIWRGYNPTTYSAATFVEMHQGAVGGLNVLLPGMALAAMLCTIALAWLAYGRGPAFQLYAGALVFMVAAGIVTRFLNQPINAIVMTWTVETLPANWAQIRDTWWTWHLVRTGTSVLAMAFLLAAVIVNKPVLK
ncbi:MAG: DUF1772 domain-containing protein [Rhodobacteraceae bacterium]|nr:DUF1772 domain-containing protein [Paracoccaceae bacterium]MCB1467874.1 DUF1772 domain-containing protein [Rhizobiaceae bacterium]